MCSLDFERLPNVLITEGLTDMEEVLDINAHHLVLRNIIGETIKLSAIDLRATIIMTAGMIGGLVRMHLMMRSELGHGLT